MLLYCTSWWVDDNCCKWLRMTFVTFDVRAYMMFSSLSSITITVDPTSHSCIISATRFRTCCSDGRIGRRCELRNDRMRRIVLYGMNVSFSSWIMSSTDSLCNMGRPAASAADATISGLRLISDVNCVWSSCACCCGVDVAGDESACNTVSCVCDRRCRVLLLHLDDPTRGVGTGNNLTLVWLAVCMVRVSSWVV